MSRSIDGKIIVTGDLVAATPVSVGGAGSETAVDMAIARNGRGEFFIPGTSLAGPIRHWLWANLKQDSSGLVDAMMGFQNKKEGHASFLFVEDAVVKLPDGLPHEIRDGIQIDRETGATRVGPLFNRMVLPRKSKAALRLELNLPNAKTVKKLHLPYNADDFEAALKEVLTEWMNSGLKIGGAKTRGIGRMKLENVKVFRYAFKETKPGSGSIFDWLQRKKPPETPIENLSTSDKIIVKKAPGIHIRIDWEPSSMVMVKSGAEGIETDMLPLVGGIGAGQVAPVIPGSSIKGAFRSRGAKILRTLVVPADRIREKDPNPDNDLTGSLLDDLFGSSKRIGRFSIDDVYQKENPIPYTDWTDQEEKKLDSYTARETHVAIDRFTGGASDSALFTKRHPLLKKAWEPIEMELQFGWETVDGKISDQDKLAEFALVLFILQDLQDNLLPIGFGTMRGNGEIKINSINIQSHAFGKEESMQWPGSKTPAESIPGDFLTNLNNAWKNAVQNKFQMTGKACAENSSGKEGAHHG